MKCDSLIKEFTKLYGIEPGLSQLQQYEKGRGVRSEDRGFAKIEKLLEGKFLVENNDWNHFEAQKAKQEERRGLISQAKQYVKHTDYKTIYARSLKSDIVYKRKK